MSINKKFANIIGTRVDWETAIRTSTNPEETFKHLLWHIPAGIKFTDPNISIKEDIVDLINEAAKALNVDADKIFEDKDIFDFRELLGNTNEEGGSKVEVTLPWDGKSFKEPEQDEEGIYLISCAEELAWLAKNITKDNTEGNVYELTEDIDLNNQVWMPIGQTTGVMGSNANRVAFRGTFDGKDHVISNFSTNIEDELAKSGLFAALEGTVKNLKVKNAKINSTHYAAVIAAYNTDVPCTIENCIIEDCEVVTVPENSTGSWDNGDKAGAVIGYIRGNGSVIKNCKVKNVNIRAYRDLGAIAGYVSDLKNSTISFEDNVIENVKLVQDLSNAYKDFDKIENHYGNVYGWKDGKGTIIDENNIGEAEYELVGYVESTETEES